MPVAAEVTRRTINDLRGLPLSLGLGPDTSGSPRIEPASVRVWDKLVFRFPFLRALCGQVQFTKSNEIERFQISFDFDHVVSTTCDDNPLSRSIFSRSPVADEVTSLTLKSLNAEVRRRPIRKLVQN